jgi:broad specificity phosphatase PhoE
MIAQLKFPLSIPGFPGYDLPPVPCQGTRVILLRHGRSTLNDAGCYQGSSDQSDLTPQGVLASRQVGQFLAHCPIDAIYVSPLTRAQNTVAALLPQLQTPTPKGLTPSSLLREIHLPDWEGRSYQEVRSQETVAYRCWQETPEHLQMQGGKGDGGHFYPVQDLYQRAAQFWQETLPRHRGQTLLVVSHGGTNQALLNLALGLSPRHHHALQQTHSGLTVLDFDDPQLGTSRLHILNLTLTERLPKLKAGKQGLRLLLLPCQA